MWTYDIKKSIIFESNLRHKKSEPVDIGIIVSITYFVVKSLQVSNNCEILHKVCKMLSYKSDYNTSNDLIRKWRDSISQQPASFYRKRTSALEILILMTSLFNPVFSPNWEIQKNALIAMASMKCHLSKCFLLTSAGCMRFG